MRRVHALKLSVEQVECFHCLVVHWYRIGTMMLRHLPQVPTEARYKMAVLRNKYKTHEGDDIA